MANIFLPGLDLNMSDIPEWDSVGSDSDIESNDYLNLKLQNENIEIFAVDYKAAIAESYDLQPKKEDRSYDNIKSVKNASKTLLKYRHSHEPPNTQKEYPVKEIKRTSLGNDERTSIVILSHETSQEKHEENVLSKKISNKIVAFNKETESLLEENALKFKTSIEKAVAQRKAELANKYQEACDMYRLEEENEKSKKLNQMYTKIEQIPNLFDTILYKLEEKNTEIDLATQKNHFLTEKTLKAREEYINLLQERVNTQRRLNKLSKFSQEKHERDLKKHFESRISNQKKAQDNFFLYQNLITKELEASIKNSQNLINETSHKINILHRENDEKKKKHREKIIEMTEKLNKINDSYDILLLAHKPLRENNIILKKKKEELDNEVGDRLLEFENKKNCVECLEKALEMEGNEVFKMRSEVKGQERANKEIYDCNKSFEKEVFYKFRSLDDCRNKVRLDLERTDIFEFEVNSELEKARNELAEAEFQVSYFNRLLDQNLYENE
ncbi:hypothetical protein SteCoe_15749 [Stentor coeruleus]|uniref:Uncharacterized protein n=1 Tax=Stentor coeruleus TaxID=5963 RepID=A0A1R2C2V0_9CILI|nr:hypothetical protein SteCoe_15749 [Stentor coeruleus]